MNRIGTDIGSPSAPPTSREDAASGAPTPPFEADATSSRPIDAGLGAHATTAVGRIKGMVAGASLSIATAMSGAGATCATGRCGQGCGYACGIIGVAAAGGIAVTAVRKRLRREGTSTL